jgi:precorrin-4 methylase
MTNFVSKLLGTPFDRLSSWLRRNASESVNFSPDLAIESGEAHSSSRDLIITPPGSSGFPPLQGGDNFRPNLRSGRPLPIQLSIHTLDNVVRELVPFFGEHCPISVIYNKSPAQMVHHAEVVQATLSTIHSASDYSPHTRSAFILIG